MNARKLYHGRSALAISPQPIRTLRLRCFEFFLRFQDTLEIDVHHPRVRYFGSDHTRDGFELPTI